jgi:O-methyltransferase
LPPASAETFADQNHPLRRSQALSEHIDITEHDFWAACHESRPATLTSIERLYALFNSVRYVVQADIPGAFAECGVWRGGSVMMMAYALRTMGVTDRDIYLFDTFEGMTPPTQEDVDLHGTTAAALLEPGDRTSNAYWAYSHIEEVRTNLRKTGYPMERFILVQGDVTTTVPQLAPPSLALLRLDTDWYASTRHELEHLFPRLCDRGVLIIDDYGHFRGARKAVDEYLRTLSKHYFLNRIDYTGRLLIKA